MPNWRLPHHGFSEFTSPSSILRVAARLLGWGHGAYAGPGRSSGRQALGPGAGAAVRRDRCSRAAPAPAHPLAPAMRVENSTRYRASKICIGRGGQGGQWPTRQPAPMASAGAPSLPRRSGRRVPVTPCAHLQRHVGCWQRHHAQREDGQLLAAAPWLERRPTHREAAARGRASCRAAAATAALPPPLPLLLPLPGRDALRAACARPPGLPVRRPGAGRGAGRRGAAQGSAAGGVPQHAGVALQIADRELRLLWTAVREFSSAPPWRG